MNYFVPTGVQSIWFINAVDGVVPDSFQPSVPDGHDLEDLVFCVFNTPDTFYVGTSTSADKTEAYEDALKHYYEDNK
jgi:hypothetical protein